MTTEKRPAVWVDPGRCGGSPCIYGTRITTEAAAGLAWRDGIDTALTCWPHLTESDILVACWYEVTHGNRRTWRKRFGDWPKDYAERMWRGRWEDVARPPTRETA